MIEWLEVENFQKFKHKKIEFDSEVTLLMGQTNAGKSTLLRALHWVCLNKPNGDIFIKSGEKSAKATIGVDKQVVVREKGKENKYQLNDTYYHAFGNGIPEDIEKLFNLDQHNFQMQLDPPFFFLDSPGDIARELNKVVNLELIDTTLSALSTQVRRCQDTERVCKERLDAAVEKRDSLSWVVEADKELKEIESLEKEYLQLKSSINNLSNLLEEIERLEIINSTVKEKIIDLESLVSFGNKYLSNKNIVSNLETIIEEISTLEKIKENAASKIVYLEIVVALEKTINEAQVDLDSLRSIIKEVKVCQETLEMKRKRRQDLEQLLETNLDSTCPLCLSNLQSNKIKTIL